MESKPGAYGPRHPHYLAIWADGPNVSEALIAQTLALLKSRRCVFLIYEEIGTRAHHSETPITTDERLSFIVRRMAAARAFTVLSDLETFALVPNGLNEFLIVHKGDPAFSFSFSVPVHTKDSTRTLENEDWLTLIEPELTVIMAT